MFAKIEWKLFTLLKFSILFNAFSFSLGIGACAHTGILEKRYLFSINYKLNRGFLYKIIIFAVNSLKCKYQKKSLW